MDTDVFALTTEDFAEYIGRHLEEHVSCPCCAEAGANEPLCIDAGDETQLVCLRCDLQVNVTTEFRA